LGYNVPRPRIFKGNGRVVGAYIPLEWYDALCKIAMARSLHLSDVLREAIKMYLEEQSVKLGIQLALGEHHATVREEEGEEDSLKILNEPGLEDLDEQLSELEKTVVALEKIADKRYYGYGYYAQDFQKHLDYAWSRVISAKKLAEKLARLGLLDTARARRVVSLYKRLKELKKRR